MPSLLLLRLFSFLSLGALGSLVPFLGAQLKALGMDGQTLGLLMAMFPVGRLVGAPVWGHLADRYQAAGLLLKLGCLGSLIAAIFLWKAQTAEAAAAAVFCFSLMRVPLGPLVDAVILRTLVAQGRDPREYGKTRLWGSVGFMGAVLVAGQVRDPMLLGVGMSAGALLVSLRFENRGQGGPAPVLPALMALAREPGLWVMLGWGMLQAMAASTYDTFFSVHVSALGMPAWVTSFAVAIGVAVEIGVMQSAHPILGRLGTTRAMLLASLSGIPRWWITATTHSPLVLVLTQGLHGISFALFWLAGVQWMAERAPQKVSASAQSLFAAASYGLGALAGSLLAGRLQQAYDTATMFGALVGVALASSVLAMLLRRR